MHTDTLHTRGCALGCYENWLWIVIPAFASTVTTKEHEHEQTKPLKNTVLPCTGGQTVLLPELIGMF